MLMYRRKFLMIISIISIATFVSGCTINNNEKAKISSNTIGKGEVSINKYQIEDISKIENLKNSKFNKDKMGGFISFEDTVSIIGEEGELVYPDENNKDLKVMYWLYTKDEHEYFLDTTFYKDQLVNIESQIVSPEEIIDITSNNISVNYKSEIANIKSYEEIKKILGEGTIVMKYFVPTNDRIYIWKYKDGYISAYVSEEDNINYIKGSSDVNELIVSSTNCH